MIAEPTIMGNRMLERFFGLERQRRKLLAGVARGAYRTYLETPLPSRAQDCRRGAYLSLDLEASSPSPERGEILGLACVPFGGTSGPDLARAYRWVRPRVGAAAAIEQELLDQLIRRLAGRTLVVHRSAPVVPHLNALFHRFYGQPLVVRIIDTQWLQRRILERQGKRFGGRDLLMTTLRREYELPRRSADVLLDGAASAGDLLLVQMERLQRGRTLRLKQLLLPRSQQ